MAAKKGVTSKYKAKAPAVPAAKKAPAAPVKAAPPTAKVAPPPEPVAPVPEPVPEPVEVKPQEFPKWLRGVSVTNVDTKAKETTDVVAKSASEEKWALAGTALVKFVKSAEGREATIVGEI